jgi:hypothetical protein
MNFTYICVHNKVIRFEESSNIFLVLAMNSQNFLVAQFCLIVVAIEACKLRLNEMWTQIL